MRRTLIAAAPLVLLAAGCGAASTPAAGGVPPVSTLPIAQADPGPSGARFNNAQQIMSTLEQFGSPCTDATRVANPTVANIIDMIDCSGAGAGDTVIAVFLEHPDAESYAQQMLGMGASVVIVGQNWAVNTSADYAEKVVPILGGQTLRAGSVVSPSESPSPSPQPATVTYSCTGKAPDGVNITYGPNGSSHSAGKLPFSHTDVLDDSAQYFVTTAQLQGSGSVSCATSIDRHDGGAPVVKNASADGGFNIAMAEVCSTYTGGWQPC